MAELKHKDWLIILQILSNMLRMFGFALILPTFVALLAHENDYFKIFLAMSAFFIIVFTYLKKYLKISECSLKHAIITLPITWICISIFSMIPFLYQHLGFVDSFFESFSGWTGSGLTMVSDPSALPYCLNFFRGYIQWIGGFGIVILALLIYEKPSTAKALFLAEGRQENFYLDMLKIARFIVIIYCVYSAIGVMIMMLSGMSLFDSIMHSITSISTGGFSNNDVGIGKYGFWPMNASIILMLIGGISFLSHYELLKGKLKTFCDNPEIRFMFWLILGCFVLIGFEVLKFGRGNLFDGFFYIVSALTGTGAGGSVPITDFGGISILIFILLMICGAAYGSTTGALKIWRILIVVKVIRREILKVFLPENAVVPVKINGKVVQDDAALKAVSYMILYMAVLMVGAFIFLFFGYSLTESVFTVASAQGNVGLNVLPAETYFGMPTILKFLLTFLMLIGRMEILPFLVLLRGFGIVKRT